MLLHCTHVKDALSLVAFALHCLYLAIRREHQLLKGSTQ